MQRNFLTVCAKHATIRPLISPRVSMLLDEGMLCIKMHIRLVPVTLDMIVCVCVTHLEDKCCPLGPRLQTKTYSQFQIYFAIFSHTASSSVT